MTIVFQTHRQLDASFRLAKAYTHWWVWGLPLEVHSTLVGKTKDEIEALCLAHRDREYPDPWEERPSTHHVTSTGRLEWLIGPSGDVVLDIHRPGTPSVLRVSRSRNGALQVSALKPERIHARHIRAAAEAVAVLDGADDRPEGKELDATIRRILAEIDDARLWHRLVSELHAAA